MSTTTFNARIAAQALLERPAEYAAIAPTLSAEQHAEVASMLDTIKRESALLATMQGVQKQALRDADSDTLDAFVSALLDIAGLACFVLPHKDSGTDGGWSGYALRSVTTPHGKVKVVITD